ncbi:glycosyltransferase family protein, partial [Acinetobacter bereziniae]|uniref:glycosyl transferase n=2 Tax=Moraxellaceae TaxID=468 RepID=UPI0021D30494
MNIGITLKPHAYTPEAYAYKKYLESFGHKIDLNFASELDCNNDINIFFMGVRRGGAGRAVEIHEYQSLSIPPFSNIKDSLKRIINKKPDGRIFLNSFVFDQMNFRDKIPYICRDMGVDIGLFQKPNENPIFDIVYSGSIKGRVGLVETLIKLSAKYKILVIGEVEEELKLIFNKNRISMAGKVDRQALPSLYASARYGLNYTPNIFPFNYQTSTKTLEYLASGLGVISNKYYWIESFTNEIGYKPIWLNDLLEDSSLCFSNNSIPDMEKYKWDNIL